VDIEFFCILVLWIGLFFKIFIYFIIYLFYLFFHIKLFSFSCVNNIGTQLFAGAITATGNAVDWHPWFAQQGIVSGYSFGIGNLTFATVLNAGHMVPQDAPESALFLFSSFISGKPI